MAGLTKKAGAVVTLATSLAAGLITYFEGTKTEAYLDPVGIPTICTGRTEGVRMGQTATLLECEGMTKADVETAMASVLALTRVPLNEHELAAYTSLVYNIGHGAFARSTLLKKLNANDRPGACKELHRWVYAKGKKLPGLVRRRAAEYQLCMAPVRGLA